MPRGKEPTPIHVLKLRGSRHRDKLPGPETERGEPIVPKFLSAAAKAVWDELLPELTRVGVVTTVDGATFGVFCETVAAYTALVRKQQKDKADHRRLNEARLTILRYAQEFGLTALARNRLRVREPEKVEDQAKERFFKRTAG